MNIRKVLFLFLLPVLAEVVISCCDCLEPAFYLYSNRSASLANLDNSGPRPVETTAPSILKSAFGIRLTIVAEKTACGVRRTPGLIGSAYATSCECPPEIQISAKDSITSLKIITLQAFDNTHPAGADVAEYFRTVDGYKTLPAFLANPAPVFYYDQDTATELDLLLMTPPTEGPEHQFRIEIQLSDGRSLQAETRPIRLTS